MTNRTLLLPQIEFFLQTLASEKGYSEHTIRAYGHDLAEFADYARKSGGAGEEDADSEPGHGWTLFRLPCMPKNE